MIYQPETIILPQGIDWDYILKEPYREYLEALLPAFLKSCRWFGGKAKTISVTRITDIEVWPKGDGRTRLVTINVFYEDGLDDDYLFPLSFHFTDRNQRVDDILSSMILARVRIGSRGGIIYDVTCDPVFMEDCFCCIGRQDMESEKNSQLQGIPGKAIRSWIDGSLPVPGPKPLRKEQSNTSFVYGNDYIFKLYRRLRDGINPEVEMIRFLTEDAGFIHIARFAGLIERNYPNSSTVTIGLLQSFVQHIDDGWTYSLEKARYCFAHLPPDAPGERITARDLTEINLEDTDKHPSPPHKYPGNPNCDTNPATISSAGLQPCPPKTGLKSCTTSIVSPGCRKFSPKFSNWIGEKYLGEMELLGKITAQLHQALASKSGIPAFAPEPYSISDREEHLQSSLLLLEETLLILEKAEKTLSPKIRAKARRIREGRSTLIARLHQITDQSSPGMKIRIHGDYHLGQILRTGDDFVIIDFEGEPARSIEERRRKRSPLIDVAGMIRSFHYAAYGAIFLGGDPDPERISKLSPWAEDWYHTVSDTFLRSYLETIVRGKADLLPANPEDLKCLLEVFLLEKAIYELNYELNNRPEWVIIPLREINFLQTAYCLLPIK